MSYLDVGNLFGINDRVNGKSEGVRTNGKGKKKVKVLCTTKPLVTTNGESVACGSTRCANVNGELPGASSVNSAKGGGEEVKKSSLSKLKKKLHVKKNEFRIVENPDKMFHEKWNDDNHPIDDNNSNLFNIPKPFRWLLIGGPGSGKTTVIFNILAHLNPSPKYVFLVHQSTFEPRFIYDPENSNDIISEENVSEYKGIKLITLKSIPPTHFFMDDRYKKNHSIVIIDDVPIKQWVKMNKENDSLVNKLFSYVSTHHNVSILSAFQDIYSQGITSIRRFSNVVTMFRPKDVKLMGVWSSNFGVDMRQLSELCNTSHDSITLDGTNDSPAPIRYNFTSAVVFDE